MIFPRIDFIERGIEPFDLLFDLRSIGSKALSGLLKLGLKNGDLLPAELQGGPKGLHFLQGRLKLARRGLILLPGVTSFLLMCGQGGLN